MSLFDHHSGAWLDVDDGACLYYEITGNPQGPALLMLHGGFGSIVDFNGLLPLLDSRYRIIGIDSRGHGRSTLGTARLSYEQLSRDLELVLEHLQIDTLSIIGFSDGGITAYRFAAATSRTILKLVTIGADWVLKLSDPVIPLLSKMNAQTWREQSPAALAAYQSRNPEPDYDRYVEATLAMWLSHSPLDYPGEKVRDIRCPTMIVRGDEDHLFPAVKAVELRERIEHAVLFNIPYASHTAFADRPELFMAGLRLFLER
jgi:pimeloyl-ACP methyl ester carboxylesterase